MKNENGETSFYVVNYKEGGYILLSSDNRIQPVLAYSESGKFTVDEKRYPLGLEFWIDDTKKQIREIRKSNLIQSDLCKKAWKEVQKGLSISNQSISDKKTLAEPPTQCYDHTDVLTVGPLLSSSWHQEGGYNDALPYINCYGYSSQVLAGCVPIAMGQVMRYFQYPSNYNWSSMPLNSGTSTTANFINDIHNAIRSMYAGNPIYNCGSTGVYASANMGSVLKSRFSYSSADWANYDWNTVKNNLNSSKPVILSGDNGSEGHMWVCDGYMQTSFYYSDCSGSTLIPMFHMNWGWEDTSYNGYYGYNNFNPAGTNFNNNKKMIYNIIP
ncbi:C10 family peptidase [Flectobacillus roseus]|uniref:C10 family peptidase n=1 Tax=Flectobacillus roseus TaxID=502259 RepID=UPI0024B6CA54|nr:C10 family peptidase [Flectobacillus roseus]MDI9871690.1 C10 family peptidase [Flectobacillus roseus]